MGGWVDGWIDVCMYGWMDEVSGWVDGWMDDGWIDIWMDG